jgi:predicted amidohydrolase
MASSDMSDVELVLFPEMFASGFSLLSGNPAQECFKLGCAFLEEISQKNRVYCAGSLPKPVANSERCLNSIQIYNPEGKLIGEYSKIHLFSFAGEQRRALPGESFCVVQIGDFRIGFFVCYDLRFPQAFAAIAEEVDAYVVLANWPAVRREHWNALLKARAIENQAYVMGVNRVGEGGGISYDGGSCLISPEGEVSGLADNLEGILIQTIDLEKVRSYREKFPTLNDRRADLY